MVHGAARRLWCEMFGHKRWHVVGAGKHAQLMEQTTLGTLGDVDLPASEMRPGWRCLRCGEERMEYPS